MPASYAVCSGISLLAMAAVMVEQVAQHLVALSTVLKEHLLSACCPAWLLGLLITLCCEFLVAECLSAPVLLLQGCWQAADLCGSGSRAKD
jgi:hypothetical protein